MPPKSAVERSPHRNQIDKKLIQGETPREISKWLANLKKNPEQISHTAINNYRKKHLNINKEVIERYQNKKTIELKEEAVEKTVSDLEFLDSIIEEAHKLELSPDPKQRITPLDIKRLGIQAIRAKQEVFKAGSSDEKEFTIKIVGVDSDEDSNLEDEQETEGEHQPQRP